LLLLATVALAPLSAGADQLLVKFDGGIGAIPVSAGVGTAATAATVIRNIVRGVQPPAQLWTIADFQAEVTVDGHIRADGRGLVFAGGNTIGTALVGGAASLKVFATLICENVAPFVNAIRSWPGFLSPRTGTSRSTTCCRLRPRRPPARHRCC